MSNEPVATRDEESGDRDEPTDEKDEPKHVTYKGQKTAEGTTTRKRVTPARKTASRDASPPPRVQPGRAARQSARKVEYEDSEEEEELPRGRRIAVVKATSHKPTQLEEEEEGEEEQEEEEEDSSEP